MSSHTAQSLTSCDEGMGGPGAHAALARKGVPVPGLGVLRLGSSPRHPLPGQLGSGLLGQQWVPRQSWQVCPRLGPMWPPCLLFRTLLSGGT